MATTDYKNKAKQSDKKKSKGTTQADRQRMFDKKNGFARGRQ